MWNLLHKAFKEIICFKFHSIIWGHRNACIVWLECNQIFYISAKALHWGRKTRTAGSNPQTPKRGQGPSVRTSDSERETGNPGKEVRGPKNEDQGQADESKVRSRSGWLECLNQSEVYINQNQAGIPELCVQNSVRWWYFLNLTVIFSYRYCFCFFKHIQYKISSYLHICIENYVTP